MTITADFHTHTHHSGDSDAPMEAMIESAIARGLSALCFTDHQDFDYPADHEPPGTFDLDAVSYREEFLALRAQYADRITLGFGVELGLMPSCVQKNKDFVSAHPFDFVIGSVHIADGLDPYHKEYLALMKERLLSRGAKQAGTEDIEREAMHFYLTSMYDNLQRFDDFDVLGHLDLCNRYWGKGRTAYRFADHEELIDAILTLLVKKDKGLDCNTNLLWKSGADDMNPSAEILKRFHALGGKILTFGSDAHTPDHVADCFDKAADIAREAGFTSYCTFASRTPKFHPL